MKVLPGSILFVMFLLIFFSNGCIQNLEKSGSEVQENQKNISSDQKLTPKVIIPHVPNESVVKQNTEAVNHNENKRADWSPLFTELRGCQNTDKVEFSFSPLPIDAMTLVEPQGELTDRMAGHIIPGDHVGFQYDKNSLLDVIAPTNGYLVRVERNRNFVSTNNSNLKNYHLYIEYSCSVFSSYVHVTSLSEEILNADNRIAQVDSLKESALGNSNRNIYVRIPVKAGQALGKATEYGLLGMLLVDTNKTLLGLERIRYQRDEPWKIHSVPSFDYFKEPLKSQLMIKNPRKKRTFGRKNRFRSEWTTFG